MVAESGYRIEITQRGRAYHWRKGSGKSRVHQRGGSIGQVSQTRIAQYRENLARQRGRNPTGRT